MAKNKSLVCKKLLEKPYLLDLRFTAEQIENQNQQPRYIIYPLKKSASQ